MTLSAVTIVMVFLSTFLFQLPIPSTQGYFNFGDIMIFTFAFAFGPVIGGISGAVGSSLSDAVGFPTFAPFTFVIKGLEGRSEERRVGKEGRYRWSPCRK